MQRWLLVLGALIAGIFFGCGDGEEAASSGYFESDVPGFDGPGGPGGPGQDAGAGGSSSAGGAAGAASGGSGGGGGSGGAEKAIQEADVIQLKDNRLYALSKYGGLSVIDVSVKDQLKLLGRYELQGEPFEMYLKDGIAFAMYSSFRHYEGSGSYWQWVQSSAIVALDVKNPSNIVKLGEFLLPGEISDSRIVGDVLYAVSYENGSCWNCGPTERTNVISLNVKVPSKVAKVDELAFGGPNGDYGWGRRSVMVTQDRMYIGGRDASGAQGSTIQIVDITDPTGKLVKGASVAAAGSIESRWQMDEKDGVLRLISQPGWWSMSNPPIVQTFQVVSSQEIKPLASLNMVLPEPERLRSVRFDGTRGYAITFRQTDPLFVIDLADPKAPKQVGELQMPGWVYHMEPRGDRLLALGFDQQKPDGALNVSLFDVADATQPKLLDRVDFGGNWGQFAEDQDRIHKAFTILDSLGLIFVPYSGMTYTDSYYGCGSWQSGIQIVSFTKDDLTERGVAPSRGTARRAFLHDARLFAVSDVAVETFDITNVDKPAAKANLALATVVSKLIAVGDKVARLGSDWYTSRTTLDVVPIGAIDSPGADAVDLEAALGSASESKCWYGYWGASNLELFAHGSHVVVVAGYDERRIVVFDVSSGKPVQVGKATIPALSSGSPYGYGYWGYYGTPVIPDAGASNLKVGNALVSLRRLSKYDYTDQSETFSVALDVVDLSNPKSPKHTSVPMPSALGTTGLIAAGGAALFSHWAPSPTNPSKVRFYADRLELGSPSAPKLSSINVPGSLLAVSSNGSRAFTVGYQKFVEKIDAASCYEKWGALASYEYDYASGNWEDGTCTGYKRTLSLVQLGGATAALLDAEPLPAMVSLQNFALGTDRVFFTSQCYDCYTIEPNQVFVASGLSAGQIQLAQLTLPKDDQYAGVQTLIADGTRAVLLRGYPQKVMVLDAKSPATPSLSTVAELHDELYGYGYYAAQVIGDSLVLPRGPYGVDVVDLTP